MRRLLASIFVFAACCSIAWADCQYNGRYYPTGTQIAGKTCQADGSWR